MALCQSCGSELSGAYCNTCGAKAQPDKAPKKARKEAPRPESPRAGSGYSPQRVWRGTAMSLLGVLIFASGMVAGFWLGSGNSPLKISAADSEFGLPPVALGSSYMDEGVEYMTQGNRSAAANSLRKATNHFGQALKENPDDLFARTYLGLTYYYLGDSKKALQELRDVLSRDANYLWAIFNLAWIYETGGKPLDAAQMYQKYLDVVESERQNVAKYAEQYDLIERQMGAAEKALANLTNKGGGGQ